MPRFNQLAYMVFGAIAAMFSAGLLAPALSAGMPAMPIGGITSQPIGHFEFCQQHRRDCEPESGLSGPARLTSFGWRSVEAINLAVNAEMRGALEALEGGGLVHAVDQEQDIPFPADSSDRRDIGAKARRKSHAGRGHHARVFVDLFQNFVGRNGAVEVVVGEVQTASDSGALLR